MESAMQADVRHVAGLHGIELLYNALQDHAESAVAVRSILAALAVVAKVGSIEVMRQFSKLELPNLKNKMTKCTRTRKLTVAHHKKTMVSRPISCAYSMEWC
eukprot:3854633-Amphidinium_carterae.1